MTHALYQAILGNGWEFPSELWDSFSDYTREFAYIELAGERTPATYASRLEQIGFTGLGRVFDAGCGIGQWSIILAQHNGFVVGQDIADERVDLARQLAKANGVENIQLEYGSIQTTQLEDASVDAVFCYGVFMFAHMPDTIVEFHRILKPGGRLYLNANSWGWYLHLLFDRCVRNRSLDGNQRYTLAQRRSWLFAVIGFYLRTLLNMPSRRVVTKRYLRRLLQDFDIIDLTYEGGISVEGEAHVMPFYPQRAYGNPLMLEILGMKK